MQSPGCRGHGGQDSGLPDVHFAVPVPVAVTVHGSRPPSTLQVCLLLSDGKSCLRFSGEPGAITSVLKEGGRESVEQG